MLEIPHQFHGLVSGTNDTQAQGNVSVLGAHRLDGDHLHAAGQNRFKIFHGQGPGERFFVKEFVELAGLGQQLRVVGPLHQGLVVLALQGNARDFAVEGVLAGARLFCLLMQGPQAQKQKHGHESENAHGHAQPLEGRSQVGEGATGEIESNPHRSACPRQCAGGAGNVC